MILAEDGKVYSWQLSWIYWSSEDIVTCIGIINIAILAKFCYWTSYC